jgi:hypothetical protein
MEIANDGDFAAGREQALFDFGDSGGSLRNIHGDAHNFGAGFGKLETLLRCTGGVCGVCVGHGLHDNGRAPTDADVADIHAVSFSPRMKSGGGVRTCDLR